MLGRSGVNPITVFCQKMTSTKMVQKGLDDGFHTPVTDVLHDCICIHILFTFIISYIYISWEFKGAVPPNATSPRNKAFLGDY